ncbi:DUF2513 domain-containing protein [Paraburkholderia pallida]|uniref:DUF2513 domain-containing protein n=1 Tax=Paraburkholderia pallida TaxID=2547399 RepID=A0A4P7CT73_9BURK|nr:DUF2513 domain-containing protein [Paraburkholderia pallida]QBQ98327.1 DUF2513 domain-containing protein [Paraburkholderia pallida]
MKRDNDLILDILKLLEQHNNGAMPRYDIIETLGKDNYTQRDAIIHHLSIMYDRGFVAVEHDGLRLTWDGHDAVEKAQRA